MEKAYELSGLLVKLKDRGLDMAEEGVKIFIEEFFSFMDESAKLSATPLDNVAAALYPELKKFLIEKADSIDGSVG